MAKTRKPDRGLREGQKNRVARSLLIGVPALLLAGIVGLATLAGVMRTLSPESIPAIWHDPIAPMAQWSDTVVADPARLSDIRTRNVAIATLNTQPLNASALWLLAGWEDTQRHVKRADYLARLSERVTRRDLLTQLFLLERAVARNDIDGALTHYDKALRVSPNSSHLLFPVLINAMKDPSIRNSLAYYVGHPAPWMGGFLFDALDAESGAVSTAQLLLNRQVPADSPLLAGLSANLLGQLVNQHKFALAEQIFAKLPGSHIGMLSDLSFSASTTNADYGPFSWQILNNTDADIAFQRAAGGRLNLYVSIPSNVVQNQKLVRRFIDFPPGEYSFQERRRNDEEGTQPFWQIECADASGQWAEIWRSNAQANASASRLTIPANCAWQQISLVAPNSVTTEGMETTIDIMLKPVRAMASGRPAA